MNGLWKLVAPMAAIAVLAIGCGDGGDDDEVTLTFSPEATVLGASVSPDDTDGATNGDGSCTPQTYEVQSGDSLSQIAVEFDVSVEAIAGASGISDPNVLQVGQELTIPCPGQLPSTPQPTEEAEESPTPAP